jgi:hypothetical protein
MAPEGENCPVCCGSMIVLRTITYERHPATP